MNKTQQPRSSRNDAVKAAYYAMLKHATQLLYTIEREELRFTLTREDECRPHGGGNIQ